MAKTWVLDTETKGTGAHIAPLERTPHTSEPARDLELVKLRRPPRPRRPAQPPQARRFKVTELMTGRVLGEDLDTREVVEVLEGAHSALDANVYGWSEKSGRWRLLTPNQRERLWRLRGQLGSAGGD